jgi:hypothetical protein
LYCYGKQRKSSTKKVWITPELMDESVEITEGKDYCDLENTVCDCFSPS